MITQFSMRPEPQNIVYFKDSQLQIDVDFTMLKHVFIEHNITPRCSYEVCAAGLSWVDHFWVQCKSSLLLATRPEVHVEGFRDQEFVAS